MKPIDASFFDEKRPWSRIKDRVLGAYLPPYLRKLQRLPQPIVIVDCFAGRGTFSDGTAGSPLIICQQIKQHAPTRASAYFVNKRPQHHTSLSRTLQGFIDTGIAHPILGQGESFLNDLTATLQGESVFVYLDPFGIKGCNFTATKRLLERHTSTSTELLMTLSMPILHRLAAHRRTKDGSHAIVSQFHAVLDDVLGEIPWRDVMCNDQLTAAQKEQTIVTAYCAQLRKYIRYVCCCPVRDRDDARVKYYIIFASRHPHALLLMNDIMLNAYQDHTFAQTREDMPLLAPIMEDWRATRATEQEALAHIITSTVAAARHISRAQLWEHIVAAHFMQFREAEFREAVQALVTAGTLRCEPTVRRLKDESILCPAPRRTAVRATREQPARLSS